MFGFGGLSELMFIFFLAMLLNRLHAELWPAAGAHLL